MAEADIYNYKTRAEASSQGSNGTGIVSGMKNSKTSVVCEPPESYYVELSKSYAEISKHYAEQCSVGMVWIPINQQDWVLDNGRYRAEINNLLAVSGVFQGSWTQKKLINADMTITDEKTIIYSFQAFNGFVLGSYSIIESDEAMGIMEVLDAMLDTNIIDITTSDSANNNESDSIE